MNNKLQGKDLINIGILSPYSKEFFRSARISIDREFSRRYNNINDFA